MSQPGYLYRSGFTAWGDWLTADHQWLLLGPDGYFDVSHDSLADVAGAELSLGGYARLDVTDKHTYYDNVPRGQGILWCATDPDFGTLDAGTTINGLVLANTTEDTLVAYWDLRWLSDGGELAFLFQVAQYYHGGTVPTPEGVHLIHRMRGAA